MEALVEVAQLVRDQIVKRDGAGVGAGEGVAGERVVGDVSPHVNVLHSAARRQAQQALRAGPAGSHHCKINYR